MKQIKPIIWGIAIIALGVIFGGNALGLFNLNVFFDGWWILFIIVPSVISFFTEKDKLMSLGTSPPASSSSSPPKMFSPTTSPGKPFSPSSSSSSASLLL